MRPPLTRRSFLAGSAGAVLLAACGGGDDDEPTPSTSASSSSASSSAASEASGEEGAIVLGTAFDQNALVVAGIEQRLPFILFESTGGLLAFDQAPETVDFEVDGETITVDKAGEDVERAYYPLVTTFAEPGGREVRATVGGTTLERAVNVNERSAVGVPQVGEPLPSAPTPTTADPLGVATICTADPPCPLHEVSLEAALATGRPVAVLVSTPAYCQVAICGPVLDLLVAAAPDHPDVDVIHVEVYPDGEPTADGSTVSPLVTDTFSLAYEPVLFVADGSGSVVARLDNIYDGRELDAALRTVSS